MMILHLHIKTLSHIREEWQTSMYTSHDNRWG